MSPIGDAGRCVCRVTTWLRVLLLCLAISASAAAQCEYDSVSGSGFAGWGGNTFYVLPEGGHRKPHYQFHQHGLHL